MASHGPKKAIFTIMATLQVKPKLVTLVGGWTTHPKNMQPSNWIMKPQGSGWKFQKCLSCHHHGDRMFQWWLTANVWRLLKEIVFKLYPKLFLLSHIINLEEKHMINKAPKNVSWHILNLDLMFLVENPYERFWNIRFGSWCLPKFRYSTSELGKLQNASFKRLK